MDYSNDEQLEKELQELYILAKHWSADLDFLEEELTFFKNIQRKYPDPASIQTFEKKVLQLETHLGNLRVNIPRFLDFMAPFIANPNKPMGLDFLEKYNALATELHQLFNDVRATKRELFAHTETLMPHACG